ncbi:MAG: aminoacyl-tRNA hydrolase [bacterium]|jgi:PTH1 family peptidyl-tRNA hydrolase|nr:aminoacyl-tRNA hydrolase [bacterium]
MYLLVGLGNPGTKYADTRHNVGFMVIDALLGRWGGSNYRRHCRSLVAEERLCEERVVLAKPQTFMNKSGEAVAALLGWYKVSIDRLLIIYDDLDLPLGQLRLRTTGSAGGHNGMRSIISCLGRQDIRRLRIGIGAPTAGIAVEYVLGRFSSGERSAVELMIAQAADAVELILEQSFEAAMNKYNRDK